MRSARRGGVRGRLDPFRGGRSGRLAGLTLAVLVWAAACSAGSEPGSAGAPTVTVAEDASGDGAATGTATAQPQAEAGPREEVPSGLRAVLEDRVDERLPEPLVDPAEILPGGPPPDGIPAIDEPKFERARDVDWLQETEGILVLTVGEETRGYPLQVMTWHEIANDTVGGVPVAVTYCPLCNSGVAFDRRVGERTLTFGTSGMLHANNLVMYDRQTESLWPQLTGEAAVGVLTGEVLDPYPMGTVGWRDFLDAHPDAWVLSRDTGHSRSYGQNPYVGNDDLDAPLLFPRPKGSQDARLEPKDRVVGILGEDDAVAVVGAAVAEAGVVEVTAGGRELVAWHQEGQASALDDAAVGGGREIGSVAVFDPVVDGRTLTFTRTEGGGFTDAETGSVWNVLGEATAGPLAGRRLEAYPSVDTFWFAWVAFQPDTRLVPQGP